MSTFDEPQTLHPEFHVYCEERLEWLDIADSLPRYLATTKG